jgi:hypothetical protein
MVTNQTTQYTSESVTNPFPDDPGMYLLWQLMDVITVFDNSGQPLASIISGAQPYIIGGPYNLNQLPDPGSKKAISDEVAAKRPQLDTQMLRLAAKPIGHH